jgi:cleavage stimulation factor subunit 3
MSGGFIMEASDDDDDEEEEEEEENPQPSGNAGPQSTVERADSMPRSASGAPPAPTDVSAAQASAPMAGLNPTALLEARVKEDPRGDMDAWLNLVADHRRRNNLDALRGVYNRFVDVFPQAVSNRCQL